MKLRNLADLRNGNKWYFAYGSNMKSSVMANRGIVPLQTKTVVVPTHCLTFDIFGIPYHEPSFASIAELAQVDKGQQFNDSAGPATMIPPVHGVAYLLSHKDFHSLVISEGGGVAYDEIEAEAYILGEGRHNTRAFTSQRRGKIVVHSLTAKYPWRPNGSPSARYMVSSSLCSA